MLVSLLFNDTLHASLISRKSLLRHVEDAYSFFASDVVRKTAVDESCQRGHANPCHDPGDPLHDG